MAAVRFQLADPVIATISTANDDQRRNPFMKATTFVDEGTGRGKGGFAELACVRVAYLFVAYLFVSYLFVVRVWW